LQIKNCKYNCKSRIANIIANQELQIKELQIKELQMKILFEKSLLGSVFCSKNRNHLTNVLSRVEKYLKLLSQAEISTLL
jgi:hypothetical protein